MIQTAVPMDENPSGFISEYVEGLSTALWPINITIHDNPELNYEEFIAHETLTSFLKTREGWDVIPSAFGIPTSFKAEYASGKPGPVVSFNAEYDALPGIGHACGHNLIATASLSAALAAGAAMKKYDVGGKIILFGTPAEEGGGGKIKMLDAGAYEGVDVNLMSHPGNKSDNALVCTAAFQAFKVEYFGKAAHAAASPWEGINALDAMVVAYTAISALRQQIMPGDIIQGMIDNGGVAPNIIHAYTSGRWNIRANARARVRQLWIKVKACFEAAALATGATLKLTPEIIYDDQMPNMALGRSYREHFNLLGGNIPPGDVDIIDGRISASSDEGNVSYALPSICVSFKLDSEVGGHNPAFAEATRTKESFEACLKVSKALAATGLDVLMKKGYIEEIKEEWKQSIERERGEY